MLRSLSACKCVHHSTLPETAQKRDLRRGDRWLTEDNRADGVFFARTLGKRENDEITPWPCRSVH